MINLYKIFDLNNSEEYIIVCRWLDSSVFEKINDPTYTTFKHLSDLFSSPIKEENQKLFKEYAETLIKNALEIFKHFGWSQHFKMFNWELMNLLKYLLKFCIYYVLIYAKVLIIFCELRIY